MPEKTPAVLILSSHASWLISPFTAQYAPPAVPEMACTFPSGFSKSNPLSLPFMDSTTGITRRTMPIPITTNPMGLKKIFMRSK
ncbi:hypothetical protein [Paenisporosarcina sp. TG-14]|uniref:hypothetical protein n=1 Tax=Paenisporosarcina sp. TG-14 TaxID=1231057 RepID=UPI001ED9BBCC|nr:hypothetical protein [Paenisporosarcina sp. TG-14]